MRLRRKKNRDTRFEKCIDLSLQPTESLKEDFYNIFNLDKPIEIETALEKAVLLHNQQIKTQTSSTYR